MNEPFDQIDPLPGPAKSGMPLGKVVLINFGIMFAYMLLTSFAMDSGPQAGLGVLVLDVVLVLGQAGLNLLIGLILVFTPDKKPLGSALLIGGVIIAVAGIASCFAHLALLGA